MTSVLNTLNVNILSLQGREVSPLVPSSEAAAAIPAFRFRMKTDDLAGQTVSSADQFQLPLQSDGTFNFNIDWGDGNDDDITAYDDAAARHTYSSAGEYDVTITGSITGWSFNFGGDAGKLLRVSEWGQLRLGGSGAAAFYNCSSMEVTAVDTLDVAGETDLGNTFNFCDAVTSIHIGNFAAYEIGAMFNAGGLARLDATEWDVSSLNNGDFFLNGATLTTADYDALLIAWAAQTLVTTVDMNFGTSQYSAAGSAEAARHILVNTFGWTVSDGGTA